jgi:hypothetical protein
MSGVWPTSLSFWTRDGGMDGIVPITTFSVVVFLFYIAGIYLLTPITKSFVFFSVMAMVGGHAVMFHAGCTQNGGSNGYIAIGYLFFYYPAMILSCISGILALRLRT